MDKDTVYAVVDIETTGTSVTDGDRIIQIGCVFVQHNQIINHFETDVNPLREIPAGITRLTGISNQRVRHAPLFDDVAGTLYSLLTNTVFVAHNVNFDLPFINAEFSRVGYPELTIEALDTVSLSQILLPTSPSFRLRDLSGYFNIEHDSPHSADSDASATAELFIFLFRRLRALPQVTLQKMIDLHPDLPLQTAALFDVARRLNEQQPRKLPDYLYIKNGLALRKPEATATTTLAAPSKYPKTKKQKQKLMPDNLEWRPEQAKMMNYIYNNYANADQHPVKQMIVEAPTGIGKSLGYTLPMAYLGQTGRPVVISTATTLLQEQLLDQTLPLLNAIVPFPVNAVLVKGSRHYLDLQRFATTLKVAETSKQTQLLKLRLLVWLTMTTTGDLDELHLATYRAPYFQEIMHEGAVTADNPFYADDFLRRRDQRLETAQMVIVNHAYLSEHALDLGERLHRPYLVIDEAQHLPDSTLKQRRTQVKFAQLVNELHHVQRDISRETGPSLLSLFHDDAAAVGALHRILTASQTLETQLEALVNQLFLRFLAAKRPNNHNQIIEELIPAADLAAELDRGDAVAQATTATDDLLAELRALRQRFDRQADRFAASERYLFEQVDTRIHLFDDQMSQLLTILRQVVDQAPASLFWLTINHVGDRNSLQLASGLLATEGFLRNHLYAGFQPVLLTGATLFSSGRSQYVLDQFDLDRDQTATHRMRSSFDYAQQAELFISDAGPNLSRVAPADYVTYLAAAISQIAGAVNKQTLVLFNSLSVIEQVYQKLCAQPEFAQREIFAQGISGSRERIAKRFATSHGAILLGAASFWEGIDLPAEQLELLIVTRLPFDSPDRVFVKANYARLEAAGKNPFYSAALPAATLKLRQGIGRLIRTPHDRGAIVILDQRLIERHYGQSILRALPADLPQTTGDTSAIAQGLVNFFEKKTNDSVTPPEV
ncbi:MAG: DEAD/DEAH box helicase [Levilactobacillus sp.]|jgi:ATP-dependent DNA helicase DinG|uniref:helicase C-terminal domain-containing protein n=1 Tax=Levilactobacillus sp. TaxID=2767919 RepID=UPI00258EA057|nr:helicase C-terminal domain-containing protein [Levilactobacillus sp.]MCH4123402.1 DEAD/DEAH box helicase [Levilactobacillus sp.]MCI1552460.1 DEAD/DEAH box helicase [Levilactobacillus sp.]MCI1599047.1 DEAD/DEAH box helicase [Levilactobacillus sp.]